MKGTVLEVSQQEHPPISNNWVWVVMESVSRLRELEIPIRKELDAYGEVLISFHSSMKGAEKRALKEFHKELSSAEHRIYADIIQDLWRKGEKVISRGDIFQYRVYKKPVEE